ncbi:MAG: dihydropteroate synthase [Bacteriovoracaceae bacterium]|nr:dihydropteroate synthase [Bacteriovoracaceae bacterium]
MKITINDTKLKLIPMGVINITPDSFSDGGAWLDSHKLNEHLWSWNDHQAIWDIGAESTSPHSQKLTSDEELKRWEDYFFPVIESMLEADLNSKLASQEISIDSYHASTVKHILERFQMLGLNSTIYWNDVSGKFDSHVVDLLGRYSSLKYVFCYNLAPTREQSQDHALHHLPSDLSEREYFLHLVKYFHSAIIQASKINALGRLILDPTFGFSKSRAFNFKLWRILPLVVKELGHSDWLIGVSRKSFLRPQNKSIHEPGVREQAEWSEAWLLGDLIGRLMMDSEMKRIYIRNHRSDFLSTLLSFHQEKIQS